MWVCITSRYLKDLFIFSLLPTPHWPSSFAPHENSSLLPVNVKICRRWFLHRLLTCHFHQSSIVPHTLLWQTSHHPFYQVWSAFLFYRQTVVSLVFLSQLKPNFYHLPWITTMTQPNISNQGRRAVNYRSRRGRCNCFVWRWWRKFKSNVKKRQCGDTDAGDTGREETQRESISHWEARKGLIKNFKFF